MSVQFLPDWASLSFCCARVRVWCVRVCMSKRVSVSKGKKENESKRKRLGLGLKLNFNPN